MNMWPADRKLSLGFVGYSRWDLKIRMRSSCEKSRPISWE